MRRLGGHGVAGEMGGYELSVGVGGCAGGRRGARYIPVQLYSDVGAGSFTALFPLITVGFSRSDH